jgi:hypothetical protein
MGNRNSFTISIRIRQAGRDFVHGMAPFGPLYYHGRNTPCLVAIWGALLSPLDRRGNQDKLVCGQYTRTLRIAAGSGKYFGVINGSR